MLIIKNMFQLLFAFFLITCTIANPALAAEGEQAQQHDHDPPEIELKVEQDREQDFTLFKLTNRAEKAFFSSPVANNYNRLLLVTESGETIEHFYYATVIPTEIKPGETYTWRMDTKIILEHYQLEKEKNLQLIWNVHGVKSAPFIFNERN